MYLGKFYKQMALLQRSKTNDNQAKKTKEKKGENEDEHSDYFSVYKHKTNYRDRESTMNILSYIHCNHRLHTFALIFNPRFQIILWEILHPA